MITGDIVSCPQCGHLRSRVLRADHPDTSSSVGLVRVKETYRRRECRACRFRFTTHAVERIIGTTHGIAFSVKFTAIDSGGRDSA